MLATAETQVARGEEMPVAATLRRLMDEGMTRREAIHAITTILAETTYDALLRRDLPARPERGLLRRAGTPDPRVLAHPLRRRRDLPRVLSGPSGSSMPGAPPRAPTFVLRPEVDHIVPRTPSLIAVVYGRDLPERDRKLLLFREKGASIYASTEAWLVEPEAAGKRPSARRLREAARAGEPGFERLERFDTFWYTWAGVNRDSKLLR